jgi:hypothetical protein
MDTSPEPEVQQQPVMMDEGCQTVGLDDGGAAEVLADFHKQASNVGSTAYTTANGTMLSEPAPQASIDAGHERDTQLPLIQTQLDSDRADMSEQDAKFATPARKAPSSPLLQPVSSDGLPLVSPLITNRFGAFLGIGPTEGMAGQAPPLDQQASTLIEEPALPVGDNAHEDLYGASPAAVQGLAQLNELNGFTHASAGMNALEEASNTPSQFLSEDQHGRWQSAAAQLNYSGSPHKVADHTTEEEQQGGFYEKELGQRFDFQTGVFPTSEADKQHLPRYPDLEDENYGHQSGASWGHEPKRTEYPDLPEDGLQSAIHTMSAVMSRSGSPQSAPVNLTESSDEDEVGEDRDDMHFENSIDEADNSDIAIDKDLADGQHEEARARTDLYGSLGEDSSEGDEEDPREDQLSYDRRLHRGLQAEDPQNSQDEEDLSEDEMNEEFEEDDEQYQGYPRHVHDAEQEESFDEDEDEGSYDEDMEDDDQPPVHSEPVVIDLLSSDDEDGGEPAETRSASEPATPRRQVEAESHTPEHESNESEADMEAEENLDTEQNSPLEPRTHASTKVATHYQDDNEDDGFAAEEDDDILDAEEDDNLPDTEDEQSNEDSIEEAGSAENDHVQQSTAAEQDNEMLESDEGLEKDAEQPVEEDEPQEVEAKPSEEKPALQEVDENRGPQLPELKSKRPAISNLDGADERFDNYIPTQQPSPRMFNIDERLPGLYPSLPKEAGVDLSTEYPPSVLPSQDTAFIEAPAPNSANGQLPTPQDTQISLVKETSEISISSVEDQTRILQSTSHQLVIDAALETVLEPVKEHQGPSAEDALINVETEPTVSDIIDEDTARASLEEHIIEEREAEKESKVVIEAHNTRSRTLQQNSLEPTIPEESQSVEEVVNASPRRSHRRGKSTSSTTEPPQTKRLTTPKPGSKTRQDEPVSARTPSERSSSIVLDERPSPKGQDASIELALAALDSPTQQQPHDLRSREPVLDMKLKLTRALRTDLSWFTALKVLRHNLTKKIDVFGVVTTVPPEPERAKSGPRHYQVAFNITDQSICPGSKDPVTEVQVFRPYKDALPVVNVGDPILLRNFQVISVKGRGFALQSCEVSSWAVFKDDAEDGVDVRGPPVEYGDMERKQMHMLREWFTDLDATAREKIDRANETKGPAGKGVGKAL